MVVVGQVLHCFVAGTEDQVERTEDQVERTVEVDTLKPFLLASISNLREGAASYNVWNYIDNIDYVPGFVTPTHFWYSLVIST